MVKFIRNIIDLVFPPVCPICKSEVSDVGMLCPDCFSRINWISTPYCSKCGYPFPVNIDLNEKSLCPNCIAKKYKYIDWIRSVVVYDEISKQIILPLKHLNKYAMAKVFVPSLINFVRSYNEKIDYIIPMPLSNKRLFVRGYNQSSLIAQPISKFFNIPVDYDSVCRIHRNSMGHLSFKERFKNIKGVFSVSKNNCYKFKGKTILIVDDVMTSGASLEELAHTLKKVGAKSVIAIVCARVIKDI